MPELDDLVRALRDEAASLPAVPLLEGVRAQARTRQRRRQGVAGGAVLASVALVAGLFAVLGSRTSTTATPRPTPRATAVVTDPQALIGPTWYLQSWTGADGKRVLPDTDRPPTVVFDSRTKAHSDDPTNTTDWAVTLGRGTLSGVEGPTTAVAESEATQAAHTAMSTVLTGPASWAIQGSVLTVRSRGRASLTYTRDAGIGLATGGLYVLIEARGYAPFSIPGRVAVSGPAGFTARELSVTSSGRQLSRLAPGSYVVTATVSGGRCNEAAGSVVGGRTTQVTVRCLLSSSAGMTKLVGQRWYLRSWSTAGGSQTPQVVPPPKLEFESDRFTTDDGCNTSYGTTRISTGALDSVQGVSTTAGSSLQCNAVAAAVAAVLNGHATWALEGTELTISGPSGVSLDYTSDGRSALATGGVHVQVWSRHGAGVLSTGSGDVAATVTLTQSGASDRTAQAAPLAPAVLVGLRPGKYTVTAAFKDAECTPRHVVVKAGNMTDLRVNCRDGLSTD